jgi:hypothetical protein
MSRRAESGLAQPFSEVNNVPPLKRHQRSEVTTHVEKSNDSRSGTKHAMGYNHPIKATPAEGYSLGARSSTQEGNLSFLTGGISQKCGLDRTASMRVRFHSL